MSDGWDSPICQPPRVYRHRMSHLVGAGRGRGSLEHMPAAAGWGIGNRIRHLRSRVQKALTPCCVLDVLSIQAYCVCREELAIVGQGSGCCARLKEREHIKSQLKRSRREGGRNPEVVDVRLDLEILPPTNSTTFEESSSAERQSRIVNDWIFLFFRGMGTGFSPEPFYEAEDTVGSLSIASGHEYRLTSTIRARWPSPSQPVTPKLY
jgi:hypothetical protein